MLIILLLPELYDEAFCRIVKFVTPLSCCQCSNNLIDLGTLVVAIFALIVSVFAYLQSNRTAKRTALDSVFTLLESNHIEIFKRCNDSLFCRLFNRYEEQLKYREVCEVKYDEAARIWETFKDFLGRTERDRLTACCKYVYHELDWIRKRENDLGDKQLVIKYVKMIQALMTDIQLFGYFVNTYAYGNKVTRKEQQDYLDFVDFIKRNGFFDDLYRHPEYRAVMDKFFEYDSFVN